ncbi:peptide deformylase [Pararhodospirillum photometricum]|uniref:Peptide deformylase n=1 Tax=Pararhodospirillum photometricum DSM 122 TaxID=1150469 RepID=H6SIY1_PARPM|nr:peptide deformylase [Pararhodospirillum photometricum]CCG07946.1 Peptide deformylase [Pararhodospirillum photometricum DSM 122]
MALLPILTAPDPRLKRKALPVERVDAAVVRLMNDMVETMYAAPGIGLAAPQVGVLKRVIVVDPAREGEAPRPMRLANPEILWASEETKPYEEGCLSVPEQYDTVVRPAQVKVAYLDETGTAREIEADGLLAVVLQHEIDHLNGTLFVDHLSALKRGMLLRRAKKATRSGGPRRAAGEETGVVA